MVFFDENGFTRTTNEDGEKISEHLRATYLGYSRIDGYPMILFEKKNEFFTFRKFFDCEKVTSISDNLPGMFGQPLPPNPYEGKLIVKIKKHNPELFNINIRELKLNRILKTN